MHLMNMRSSNHSGFTMIEVLVALIVLAIGLLGVAGVQALSLKQTANANTRSLVNMYAYDLSERMRAESKSFNDYEKAISATCGECNVDIKNWHEAVVLDIPTAETGVSVFSVAGGVASEITIRWTERDLGNDAVTQDYKLYVRLR